MTAMAPQPTHRLSGDRAPHFTTLAAFVSGLDTEIAQLFAQILTLCDQEVQREAYRRLLCQRHPPTCRNVSEKWISNQIFCYDESATDTGAIIPSEWNHALNLDICLILSV